MMQVLPPTDPLAVPQGQLIGLRVDSSDHSGEVRIDLQLDGQLIDARMLTSAVTFLIDTSELESGSTHEVTVIASNSAGPGAPGSFNIAMTSTRRSPVASCPTSSTILRGQTLSVSAHVTDDTRVARVDVFIDGSATPAYAGVVAPYQFGIDTTFVGEDAPYINL